jgi:nucleoside-diphosphate-sugar epimerase
VSRRVLVTGASGFVGRRTLAPLVERGFEVHAVVRRTPAGDEPGVHTHAVDLLDDNARRALVQGLAASHLLHLAWFAEPGAFWTAPENAAWVAATVRLAYEFAEAGGERAVLAGSCAEYDWGADQPLREDSPLRPGTFYGVCKDATRRVVEALGEHLGLAVAWGRIFFLYGPGEDERRLVASVARALARGERAPVSEGSQVRDFLHVDDVAGAFAALVDSDARGPLNVASGEGVAVRQLAELLAQAAGRPDLLDIGAVPPRPGDPPAIVGDPERLRHELSWRPQLTLEDGLEQTLAWWAAQAG